MKDTILPRGVASRALSGSFLFLALAPVCLLIAAAVGRQSRGIGVMVAAVAIAAAVIQLGSTATWNPGTRRLRLGLGPLGVSRQVPAGVDVVTIPKAAYKGAPWNGIGYYPEVKQQVVDPMPAYLPGSGWLGDRRRAQWLREINGVEA